MARLLVVDDEKSLCQLLEIAFRQDGHIVETVSSGKAALTKLASQVYDLIVSDIRMPDLTGIELLEEVRAGRNPAAFILITAVPTVSTAIQALNLGAYRYVIKTDKLVEELRLVVARALEDLAVREENVRLRRELLRVFAQKNIVGHSRKIESILEMVRTVAPTTSTILITGEAERERSSWRGPYTRRALGVRNLLSPSTAGRFLRRCWRANSSAISRGPSRELRPIRKESSKLQTVELSSSTKSVRRA